MKIIMTLIPEDKDVKFFDKLMTDGYSWATSAELHITGIGVDEKVDASWVLRCNVALDSTEDGIRLTKF